MAYCLKQDNYTSKCCSGFCVISIILVDSSKNKKRINSADYDTIISE